MRVTYFALRFLTFVASTTFASTTIYRQWYTHTLHFFRDDFNKKGFLLLVSLTAALSLVFLLLRAILVEVFEMNPLSNADRKYAMRFSTVAYIVSALSGLYVYLEKIDGLKYLWNNNPLVVILYCAACTLQISFSLYQTFEELPLVEIETHQEETAH